MSISADLVQTIASFVPSCLVRQILSNSLPAVGEIDSVEAAVLFADISGFTPMSEALARVGRQGAEDMNQHLNNTFSATIACIVARNGEVAAFGGDAILAFFPRQTRETAEGAAWRALTCAAEMQEAMRPFSHVETLAGPFSLRMKFGLSYGRIVTTNVGSPALGLEFVLAGAAVDRAARNENHAESQQIIADSSLLDLVGERARVVPITTDVRRVLQVAPAPSQVPQSTSYERLSEDQKRAVLETVAPYLPGKLYEDLTSKGRVVGDHRPVTNLFLYFDGLDYDDDPEVGSKLQAYVANAQEIIHRYDGTLNRVLTGDKGSEMHILFGAPVAHEDDKSRALRCALVLQRIPDSLAFILGQRIGLASGYVFAGPVGAISQRHRSRIMRGEYTVMGDIVNLSARLTGICPPGQVIVDEYTRSRTVQRFEFRSFGPVELKGKSQPVEPHLLDRERSVENTLVTRYLLSQRPLVGRRPEMAVIRRIIDQVLDGHVRILSVTGPAGVGKSRLVEEAVRAWLRADGVGYGGDCASHGMEIPYLPWADLWRAQFDLHENDTPQERKEKILQAGADLGIELGEWVALTSGILGLAPSQPGEEHPALAPLDPQARHRRFLELTTDLVAACARHKPTLLLFEDVHWADHASVELIDHIAEQVVDHPLLICIAFRPRDRVSLCALDSAICQTLRLEELSVAEETDLIHGMLGDVDLSPAFADLVHAKAQGNPLFVEELVNSLKDAGLLDRDNDRYRVVGDLERIVVPDTLEAVLLARIDRLAAPSRDLLRIASVIGRQFAFALLQGIYPYTMAETEMLDRLTGLEHLDLTRLERPEPELEYLFKHALTQEVAYESLSFALRRGLHRRIGGFLERRYRQNLEAVYGTLTHHYTRGERLDRALVYALSAGRQAQALFANEEALAYYHQAEHLLDQLSAKEHQQEAEQLYLGRGELHTLLGNFDEAEIDLERGLRLARKAKQRSRSEARALNSQAYLRYWQARNEEMLDLARRALALAEAEGHQREMMMGLRYSAVALAELGRHDEAIEAFSDARTLAEAQGDRRELSAIHMGIAVSAFKQGRLRDALDALMDLLVIYRESGDKHRVSDCLSNIANTQYYLGDFGAAHATFQESISIDRSIGRRAALAYGLCDLARLECHGGDYQGGRAALEEASTIFKEIGDDAGRAYAGLVLAREHHLDVGHQEQAEALLLEAIPVLQTSESPENEAEALLALGRLYLNRKVSEQAHQVLEEAFALCQDHGLYWQLPEAYARLSELALDQGDAMRARTQAISTLDAVASGGCADFEPTAHLVMAQLSEDPLSHYLSAVDAARRRSRRVDLTRTLMIVAGYLSSLSDPERRAQGEAYVQEARALAEAMALSLDIVVG